MYKGTYSNQPVAIKELFAQTIDKNDIEEFEKEATLLSSLHHPNIVQFYGVAMKGSNFYLVLEWCARGSLSQLLSGKRKHVVSEKLALRLATSIAETMSFLHSKGIIHRDLKPDNILLSENFDIKLCDFGLSKRIENRVTANMTLAVGTPAYMAPELLGTGGDEKLDGMKLDVYAFAVLLNALLCSRHPFARLPAMSIISAVKMEGARPQLLPSANPELKAIIQMCWHRNPALRPNFPEITRALRAIQSDKY